MLQHIETRREIVSRKQNNFQIQNIELNQITIL